VLRSGSRDVTLSWPAIWLLGAGQCAYWGILYYTFSVLLVPMREEFAASNAAIAGAFSAGLATSALLALRVGHWLDRGHGAALMRLGALAGAALLLACSYATSLTILYAVWIGLGACMSLVLYETAFALVTRALDDGAARLSALASVTVMGGLASTLFVPLAGVGVTHMGWRLTLRAFVVVWLLTAVCLERFALPPMRHADGHAVTRRPLRPSYSPSGRAVALAGAPFVVATLAAMALTTLVIPSLVDRGHPLQQASWVLAALGVMQLPGRIWFWRSGGQALSARTLLMGPLVLQAAGLVLLAGASQLLMAFAGVALFGVGAGLHTLARPWLVPHLFGVAATGQVNGAIARAQGIARAAGPFLAAAAYERVGSAPLFVVLALALLAQCPLAAWAATRTRILQRSV